MIPRDIDCKDLVELVTEYLEYTLPAGDVERIEAHLRECDGCEEFVRQMRLTRQTLATFDAEALAPSARAALLATFRQWKSEPETGA